MTEERRKEIVRILKSREKPIVGSELAKRFNVSRQVIVQDIAVLRARGLNIISTSNGYFIAEAKDEGKNIVTVVCSHFGYDAMMKELSIMIEMGAKVIDVIVSHPVYGEIRCPLMLNSKYELDQFIEKVRRYKAQPLATLTDGEHIHTLEVPNEEVYRLILEKLEEEGILIKGEL